MNSQPYALNLGPNVGNHGHLLDLFALLFTTKLIFFYGFYCCFMVFCWVSTLD